WAYYELSRLPPLRWSWPPLRKLALRNTASAQVEAFVVVVSPFITADFTVDFTVDIMEASMVGTAAIGVIPFMVPELASVLASALGLVRSGEDTRTGLDMGRGGVHRPITIHTLPITILLLITQTPRRTIAIPATSTRVFHPTRRIQIRTMLRP